MFLSLIALELRSVKRQARVGVEVGLHAKWLGLLPPLLFLKINFVRLAEREEKLLHKVFLAGAGNPIKNLRPNLVFFEGRSDDNEQVHHHFQKLPELLPVYFVFQVFLSAYPIAYAYA